MEWLLWVLIIWLIAYSMGRKKGQQSVPPAVDEDSIRLQLRVELEELANLEHNHEVAKGLRRAGNHIHPTIPPLMPPHPAPQVDLAGQELYPKPVVMPTKAASPEWLKTDVADLKHMDSASVLLYFGAFLMIAGVGVFVGLSDFSGAVKTIAVALLGFVFYGGGMYLYNKIERLRPAGITFTAIGLISLPLTGVAAYTYLTNHQYGPAIWFATSLICLVLYGAAIWRIRQSFIGYLSVFMCLSLWMSIVSVVDAPVYFFGWAAVVLAMIYLIVVKRFKLWHELEEPLNVSATIMVPTALLLTVLFGGDAISLLHRGITVLLAAGFYAQATWLAVTANERTNYFTLANSLVLLGVGLVAYDIARPNTAAAGFWVSITAALQLLGGGLLKKRMPADWLPNLGLITAAGFVVAAFMAWTWHDYGLLAWLLGLNLAAHTFGALYIRNKIHMGLGLIVSLILPFLIGFMALDPPLGRDAVVGMYLLLGGALMLAAHYSERLASGYRRMSILAYATAWILAWLIANIPYFVLHSFGGSTELDWLPATTTLTIAVLSVISAYYEWRPKVIYVAGLLGVMGAWEWALLANKQADYLLFAVVVCSVAVAYYAAGKLQERYLPLKEYWQPWALSGITWLYVGSVGSMLFSFPYLYGGARNLWPAAFGLLLAGTLTAYESWRRHERTAMYIGGAVVIAALEVMLYQAGLREWQLYWYIWALYPIFIGYRENNPAGIVGSAVLAAIGIGAGVVDHQVTDLTSITLWCLLPAAGYYIVGKVHQAIAGDQYKQLADAWSYTGIVGLYLVSFMPFWVVAVYHPLLNTVVLMAAGATTSYEGYRKHSRLGLYAGGAVTLAGLQWLIYMQDIHEFQIYSHMWALYFALLAWLSHRDGRLSEKQSFTVLALLVQTLPLAFQALQGDAGYGLLLLFESIGIMLFGLFIKYQLVSRWALAVAVGSVLYQLREYQFFVLVLLGAAVLGVGVYLLLRNEKKTH